MFLTNLNAKIVVVHMRMQVILNSRFARPGSAPMRLGKNGEFRDWTRNQMIWECLVQRNRKILYHPSHGIPGISNWNIWWNGKRPQSTYACSDGNTGNVGEVFVSQAFQEHWLLPFKKSSKSSTVAVCLSESCHSRASLLSCLYILLCHQLPVTNCTIETQLPKGSSRGLILQAARM